MRSTRIFIYVFITSMTFHLSVSAGSPFYPFTATAPFLFSPEADSSGFVSFISNTDKKKVSLNWIVTDNEEISQFEVESSTDGKTFRMAALVFATERSGRDNYYFFEKLKKSKTYYRVKAITKSGSVTYSRIILARTTW